MDWHSMLHHISIFYALLAANVMIQTVTSFLLSMLNWYLQVSHMLSCDYYSQICSCWSHVILGTIFMNCGLLHNRHIQMFCILLGAVHIVCTFLVKCILKYISMCNVECYVLLQVISFSQNEISVETAAFMYNRFGFISIVVLTLHIHIIVFSMCHSCDIMNYLTMWLFHVHNDNDISHITDVTISYATMVTS